MKQILIAACFALTRFLSAQVAAGHGTPINVYVHAGTGQLAVFDGYEPGELTSFAGSDIFSDSPGIGISSPLNGIVSGAPIQLNVLQGLLYWDGHDVTPTNETLILDWPDAGGTSPVEFYEVATDSGLQSGMVWGIYRPAGGNGGWDAHGDYALESASPDPGIYGVVLQLAAPNYVASEPFLVPLVYDPSSSYAATQVAIGIAELQQAVTPLPTADFDRNTFVNVADMQIWLDGYGNSPNAIQLQGDANDDGNISGDDFLDWQQQHEMQHELLRPASVSVPEPATTGMFVLAMFVWISTLRFNDFYTTCTTVGAIS
jgi:hypothetical protein